MRLSLPRDLSGCLTIRACRLAGAEIQEEALKAVSRHSGFVANEFVRQVECRRHELRLIASTATYPHESVMQ